MVYNTKSKTSDDCYCALDIVFENCENDLWLFENVIESDFLEASADNEENSLQLPGPVVYSEKKATAKKILDQISELIDKAVKAIKSTISTWIAKIENIIANDKGIYEKYIDAFEENSKKECKVKFRPMTNAILSPNIDDPLDAASGVYDKFAGVINKIPYLKTDAISTYIDNFKNSLKDSDPIKSAENFVFSSEESAEYDLTDKDAELVKETMKNPKKLITFGRKLDDYLGKGLESAAFTLNEYKKKGQLDNGMPIGVEVSHAWHTLISGMISYSSKFCTALVNNAEKALAQCRRIFLSVARGSAVVSSEMSLMVGIASDLYMESMMESD